MRLAVLTSSYPLYDGDYRGGFVKDLENALRSHGIDSLVLVPRPPSLPSNAVNNASVFLLPELIPLKGYGFHGFGIEENLKKNPLSILNIPPFLFAFTFEALRFIKDRCDAILAHWVLPMGLVGAILSSILRKPLFIVSHSFHPYLRLPVARRLTSFVLSRARKVACVSQSVARSFAELAPSHRSNLDVIPLGIDIKTQRLRTLQKGENLRLCFVGRLTKLKGAHVLLQAMIGLKGVELTIVGDGPERKRLEALAQANRLNNIAFLGEMKRNEARKVMQNAHALVIPSVSKPNGRSEGLPTVLLEAWSCGLPVIASRNGGIVEAVERFGGGILFKSEDPQALRNVIVALKDKNTLEKLSREASIGGRNFSWKKLSQQWANWFRENSGLP